MTFDEWSGYLTRHYPSHWRGMSSAQGGHIVAYIERVEIGEFDVSKGAGSIKKEINDV